MTVLFCDIRGFTSLSESLNPEAVVSMLNEFFEIMVEIVFRHDGALDKFIGDELMAVWGAPVAQEDHLRRALKAAVEMGTSLDEFNRFRTATEAYPFGLELALIRVRDGGYMVPPKPCRIQLSATL